MTKDEALKLALEALEAAYARIVTKCEQNLVTYNGVDVDTLTLSQEAITAINEALAQPEQEPVAWMSQDGQRVTTASNRHDYPDYETRYSIPLYTTPPQRTWVGLTDEELPPLAGDNGKYMELQQVKRFYKYIEAKLKEKNK